MLKTRKRRTQEERTAETKAKILNATLDVMEEDGIADASTAAIARRAGVSRGALSHHYESKFDLIVAAVEFLLNRAIGNIEKLSEQVSAGEATIEDVLDRLWEYDNRRLFIISLDYLSAARTDEKLYRALMPLGRAYQRHLDEIWSELSRNAGIGQEKATVVLDMMLCLMRGMCLHTVLRDDEDYFNNILAMWRESLPHVLGRKRA